METLVLEDEVPANGILSFISQSDISCLVLGSSSSNYITRFGVIALLLQIASTSIQNLVHIEQC